MHSQSSTLANQNLKELWVLTGCLECLFSAEVSGSEPLSEKLSGYRYLQICLNSLKLNENVQLFCRKKVMLGRKQNAFSGKKNAKVTLANSTVRRLVQKVTKCLLHFPP